MPCSTTMATSWELRPNGSVACATRRAKDGAPLDGIRAHQLHLILSDRERGIPATVRHRRDEIERTIATLRDQKRKLAEDDVLPATRAAHGRAGPALSRPSRRTQSQSWRSLALMVPSQCGEHSWRLQPRYEPVTWDEFAAKSSVEFAFQTHPSLSRLVRQELGVARVEPARPAQLPRRAAEGKMFTEVSESPEFDRDAILLRKKQRAGWVLPAYLADGVPTGPRGWAFRAVAVRPGSSRTGDGCRYASKRPFCTRGRPAG